MMLLPLLLLVGFMMLMSRSDKKRRAELENKLKRGDRVVTRAGFIGKIAEIADTHARIEIAPGVVVKMVKSAIEGLAEDETSAKASKDTKDAKDAKEDKEPPSDKDAKKKK